MMDVDLWVVQGNLGKKEDVEAIRKACIQIGCCFQKVDVIPFSLELPEIETDQSVVFYGLILQWYDKFLKSLSYKVLKELSSYFDSKIASEEAHATLLSKR